MIQRARRKVSRDLQRFIKHAKQHFVRSQQPSRPLFICGAQRSGTNMLQGVLNFSIQTRVYNEDHPKAFTKYRLRDLKDLSNLIKKAPCKWVVFKCIMDSQHTEKLLDHFPESKCIWIYRDYRDVAESAARKWGDAQRHIIRNIAERDNSWQRWYTETLSDERRELVRTVYHPEISELSAGALKWFLRNKLFFDMQLEKQQDRVLLLNYNRLVTSPREEFARISRFLAIAIPPETYSHVHDRSLQKPLDATIDPRVTSLCDQLMRDFMRIIEPPN